MRVIIEENYTIREATAANRRESSEAATKRGGERYDGRPAATYA